MVKKIILSFSLVLFSIICFSLMGTKVYANSQKVPITSPTYDIWWTTYNDVRGITLKHNNENTMNYYPLGYYAPLNSTINNNVLVQYDESIAISTTFPSNSATVQYEIDIDGDYSYYESILHFNYLDNSQENKLNITFYNYDVSYVSIDYITIYHMNIYYERNGIVDVEHILGPIQFTLSNVRNNYNFNDFTFWENLLNSEEVTYDTILFATDLQIGIGSSTRFHTIEMLCGREATRSELEDFILNNGLRDGTFNIWEDFLYPTFNSLLDTELFFGLTIGTIISIAIAIPMLMWFLRIFFGG